MNAIKRLASDCLSVKVDPITLPRDQFIQNPRYTGYCVPGKALVSSEVLIFILKVKDGYVSGLEKQRGEPDGP